MNPIEVIELEHGLHQLRVSRFGAHLLSWHYQGKQQLWLSELADLSGTKPIRGGVPLCFPWFGDLQPGPSHGFARTSLWQLHEQGSDKLIFRLTESDATLALWPHRFEALLCIELEQHSLSLSLTVRNTDQHPWSFSGALHSYFAVDDVNQCQLPAIQGRYHHDKLSGQRLQFDTARVPVPVDSVVPDLHEMTFDAFTLRHHGADATVVWNPGLAVAAKMADVDPASSHRFLCLEAAIAMTPIRLAPGQTHELRQCIDMGA
ncbi:D-hexose-6-phosphate mutarotase [Ferrimonas pelagia]|uniref:glucose-6-phosphate 1-epimerase n=1 Tax=Ferrimonas pelagia TaxID=1177826 RepID=A0ABP9F4H0_9GAMM